MDFRFVAGFLSGLLVYYFFLQVRDLLEELPPIKDLLPPYQPNPDRPSTFQLAAPQPPPKKVQIKSSTSDRIGWFSAAELQATCTNLGEVLEAPQTSQFARSVSRWVLIV